MDNENPAFLPPEISTKIAAKRAGRLAGCPALPHHSGALLIARHADFAYREGFLSGVPRLCPLARSGVGTRRMWSECAELLGCKSRPRYPPCTAFDVRPAAARHNQSKPPQGCGTIW
jgi:hypothetical protein